MNEIPDSCNFEMYRVDFSFVKELLLEKCLFMKTSLIDIANQKCIKYESMILRNYALDYEKLEKTPENIDEIERIIQLINSTRDSGSGHVQFNEENIKMIKG